FRAGFTIGNSIGLQSYKTLELLNTFYSIIAIKVCYANTTELCFVHFLFKRCDLIIAFPKLIRAIIDFIKFFQRFDLGHSVGIQSIILLELLDLLFSIIAKVIRYGDTAKANFVQLFLEVSNGFRTAAFFVT